MAKNQSIKISTEFLEKTVKTWQSYSDVSLTSKDALEITENMTALFNFLIVSENQSIDKSMNKKGGNKNAKRTISKKKSA